MLTIHTAHDLLLVIVSSIVSFLTTKAYEARKNQE